MSDEFPDPLFYMIGTFTDLSKQTQQQKQSQMRGKQSIVENTASYIEESQALYKTVQYERFENSVNQTNNRTNNQAQATIGIVNQPHEIPFQIEQMPTNPGHRRAATASKDMRKSYNGKTSSAISSHDSSRQEKSQERNITNKTSNSIEQSIQRIRGALIKAKISQAQKVKKNIPIQKIPQYKKEAYEEIFQKRKEIYDKMRLSLMSPINKINFVKTPSPILKDRKKSSQTDRVEQLKQQY